LWVFSNSLKFSWITYTHDNTSGLKTLNFSIAYNKIFTILRNNIDGSDSNVSGAYCYHAIRSYTATNLTCMFPSANRINGAWFLIIGI